MGFREWLKPPRHLVVMFFGITLISAASLGWLSWKVVQQDRALARQQAQEGRDTAAHLLAAALQKDLSELEERLTSLANIPEADLSSAATDYSRGLAKDSVLVILRPSGVEAYPPKQLLYYPALPKTKQPPGAVFAEADAMEVRQKNYPGAIALLKELTRSQDAVIRAEALQRLGRNLGLANRRAEAITAYEQLSHIENAAVPPGIPADLAARVALISMLQRDDKSRATREALGLYEDLHNGRWQLEGPVYRSFADEARRWLGSEVPAGLPSPDAVAAAEAVDNLWEEWQNERSADGRQPSWVEGRSILVVARSSPERTVALAAGPRYVESRWLLQVKAELDGFNLALADTAGRPVIGTTGTQANTYSLLLGAETGLPWNLYAMAAETSPSADAFSRRTQLVMGGVAAIALLVVGGSYLIGRAVARELALARQQSDFVSAVSHEFRTPLTALRQLSELLVQDRVPNDDLRRQYYAVLQNESGRLQRLVEGLLKFGRMEAGAAKYQFADIDTSVLLRSLVEEFSHEADRQGCRVELHTDDAVPHARGDREALSCVVWNLLDNAVKYSPECHTVWVDLARENGHVAIRVRDKGVGIPREDRERIFQKFVRGETAKSMAVPGTGIGLAVARQIILKHGGEIRLDSEPGAGSTFTVLLPVAQGASS